MNVKLALMNLCLKYGSSSSLLLDSVVCSCFPPIAVGEFIFFFKTGSLAFIWFFIRLQLFSDILLPAAALAFLLQPWLHLLLLFSVYFLTTIHWTTRNSISSVHTYF